MNDTVRRLREKAACGGIIPIGDMVINKAADEIESLQARLAEAEALLREAREEVEWWTPCESTAAIEERPRLNRWFAKRDRIDAFLPPADSAMVMQPTPAQIEESLLPIVSDSAADIQKPSVAELDTKRLDWMERWVTDNSSGFEIYPIGPDEEYGPDGNTVIGVTSWTLADKQWPVSTMREAIDLAMQADQPTVIKEAK